MKTLAILLLLSAPAMAMQVTPEGKVLPGNKLQVTPSGKVIPDYGYGMEVTPSGKVIPKTESAQDQYLERSRKQADDELYEKK